MKKILTVIGLMFVLLISVILIKTMLFTSKPVQVQTIADIEIGSDYISQNLSQVLQFQTISYQDSTQFDERAFKALHAYLEEVFPNVHTSLKKEVVNNYSLLYTWQGRDESLKPILLMAHQDVVPVTPETEKNWAYPPFEGRIAEGYVWGRGALDDKSSMMAILESIEELILDGFVPKRGIYFAFGHDEEIGGKKGAAKISELFQSRKIQLEYVLDEGGVISRGIIPDVSCPIALIAIAEKGYISLKLKVEAEGGHSSIPPRHTAVGILSKAITRLEEHPFPTNLDHITYLFAHVGPKMPFFQKMVFANLWLFSPLIEHMLNKSPETDALIRTTTAATMISGGTKENVLPIESTAIVNFRILPGENINNVIEHVKKTVNDPRVQIKTMDIGNDPSSISDIQSNSYKILQETIHQIAADSELVVAPFLGVGGTDSRYFTGLTKNVYRFLLIEMGPEDVKRMHGTNERISIENYSSLVKFYYQLIRNSEQL